VFPHLLEIFMLNFLGTVATIVIACAVAYITYRQLSLDKLKFKWDLFDRRVSVYVAVQKILGETLRAGTFPLESSTESFKNYWEARHTSEFIFGDDIKSYLDEIWKRGVKLHSLDQQRKDGRLTREQRTVIVEKSSKELDWFVAEMSTYSARFNKYLKVQEMEPFEFGENVKRILKFNLSQKIYSVAGVVGGILVYMNDKDDSNVAVGLVLLTGVLVFLCKYQKVKKFVNVSALLGGILIAVVFGNSVYQNQQYKRELARQEAFEMDRYYYSVVLHQDVSRKYSMIHKFQTMKECKEEIEKSSDTDVFSKECVQGDGRYDDIFIRKEGIGKWYFLHGYDGGDPFAIVYEDSLGKSSEVIAEDMHKEFTELVKGLTAMLEDYGGSLSLDLVDPKGKVEEVVIDDKGSIAESIQLSKTESRKWAGNAPNKTTDGFYYAVTVTQYMKSTGGFLGVNETMIIKLKDRDHCENYLRTRSYDTSGDKIATKKCVGGDGRFDALFNKGAIGQWYIRWDHWMDLSEDEETFAIAKVFAFTSPWNQPRIKENQAMMVHGRAEKDKQGMGEFIVDIWVVSPDGQITKY